MQLPAFTCPICFPSPPSSTNTTYTTNTTTNTNTAPPPPPPPPGLLLIAGPDGRLDPSKVTAHAALHLLLAEQAFRLSPAVQALYGELRRRAPLLLAEDLVQRAVLAAHGGWVDAAAQSGLLAELGPGSVGLDQGSDDLGAYRRAVSQHSQEPEIRSRIFFLRNNIVVPHAAVGSVVPDGISLHLVSASSSGAGAGAGVGSGAGSGSGVVSGAGSGVGSGAASGAGSVLQQTPRGGALSLGALMDAARQAGKLLLLLCGSLT